MTDPGKLPSGRFTPAQAQVLAEAGIRGLGNPSFLSDLEGAGPISTLEEALKSVVGKQYVLALSSCTAAIHATLLALGIGPGDEVIVTPYSWGQSVAPVLFTGATAVFADIDATTLCLDPLSVQERISPRTRAILPVHLFGCLTDLTPLRQLAYAHDLALIVDAAHALGCRPEDSQMAAWGDIACFSLGRGKLICGGEGGFLATDNADLYEKTLLLTQHASRAVRELGPNYGHCGELGINYRMHPLAAVLALADLAEMENRLAQRRSVWQAFHQGLGYIPGLLPVVSSQDDATWSAYGIALTVSMEDNQNSSRRNRLVSAANEAGLTLRPGPVRTPLHLRLKHHPMLVAPHSSHTAGSCPIAEQRCQAQELWMLSALDMDGLSEEESQATGERIRDIYL